MLDTLKSAPELHVNSRAKDTKQQPSELADDPVSALRLDNDFLVSLAHLGTPYKTTNQTQMRLAQTLQIF